MAAWFPPLIDTDAILWGIFIVGILLATAIIGLWQLAKRPFLGIFLLAVAFIGAVIYFQLADLGGLTSTGVIG